MIVTIPWNCINHSSLFFIVDISKNVVIAVIDLLYNFSAGVVTSLSEGVLHCITTDAAVTWSLCAVSTADWEPVLWCTHERCHRTM